jgi:hypothetical protein
MGMSKAGQKTCHRCGMKKAARIVQCKNCDNRYFCNSCINKWLVCGLFIIGLVVRLEGLHFVDCFIVIKISVELNILTKC